VSFIAALDDTLTFIGRKGELVLLVLCLDWRHVSHITFREMDVAR
jgi:hypothetical protein